MGADETTSLTCGAFFDGSLMHGPSRLVTENGRLVAVEDCRTGTDHFLLAPGLVDLQVNGFGTHDAATADAATLLALDDALLQVGTTTWLATLVTDRLDRMEERIGGISHVLRDGTTGCAGIHLEGPFLGRRAGAHARQHILDPDTEWLGRLPSTVRLVTIGAESAGAPAAASLLHRRGVTVSVGHSAPTRDEFAAVVEAGARMVTHLFNAMSGVHHREDSLALSALTDPRVRLGVIADTVHVSPDAVKLAFMARPSDICLVSDSVAWAGEWAERAGVSIRDGAPRLADGTLAGSSTPLAECVRHAVNDCGVDPSLVLAAATSVPASTVGLNEAGRLAPGCPADIVSFDSAYSVAGVWRRLPSARDFTTER